jgi:hypothetical protein
MEEKKKGFAPNRRFFFIYFFILIEFVEARKKALLSIRG